ncbi:MAG: hypothetical protein JW793_06320 [Acidobacteria bacterium]|nr:hypothetical protein [Acidobacteriota bacterium]
MSQDEKEETERRDHAPARAERHLARSLEDVSHLFLSRRNAGAGSPDPAPGSSTGRIPAHDGEPALFLLEDRSRIPEKESLVSLLDAHAGVLEDGLRAIDTNVPMDCATAVDLVAVDRFNKLCLVDIDTSGGDALLLRGICHFDWFVRNVAIVGRMYRDRAVDFSAHPRLLLVAPKFSAMFRCAAQRIACTRIQCYLCRAAEGPGGTGVLLTRI